MDQFPGRSIAQQAGDQGGVHGVSSPLSHDPPQDAMADQGQITDQVEHFMADELVVKAKRSILHRAPAKNNRVLFRRAADQTHVAQHLLIFAKSEGTRGGNLGAVRSGSQVNGECLAADGVGEMDVVGDAVAFAGIDGDELAVLPDFHTLQYAQILPPAPLAADAYLGESFHVREGAPVEDRQLQIVQLNDDVVDAHADEGGKKMLGGGDEHTLAHDAGGVADLGDISAGRCNLVVVQIGATEDHAGTSRRGQ